MFLKRMTRRVGRKKLAYWALVESVRTERGPRQVVVAHLGELRGGEESGWAKLAGHLDGKDRPRPSLFDPPGAAELDHDAHAEVNLRGIRLTNLRDFGDVWLALGLWRLLKLDELLGRLMCMGREDVPWAVVAAILVIGRFCEPSSEMHIEDTWYPRTALEDLLGVAAEKVHTDRLYEGLDELLRHKEAIEKHLKEQLGNLFDVKYELLLYDITSTYFEGECLGNPMALRGYSRDSRPDCKQVCIGLIVTEEGMPLAHEVFDGNTGDSTTVQEMVERIEGKYGRANRIWVLDRGMVSEKNLGFIRQRNGSYLVGTPRAMLRKFERELTEQDWTEVRAGVEVKLVPGAEGTGETFILARSRDRVAKEQAMHQRFLGRLEEGLKKLGASAASGRLKDAAVANRRLGRLLKTNWRASKAFEVSVEPMVNPMGKAKLKVTWRKNPRWSEWNVLSEGCYLLRTNLTETDPAVLWKRYIQLTEAEWAFRITKDELEIRPIWHHKSERVKGHILVCFLAYVQWKTLSQWMKGGGLGQAPRTVVEEFARIKSGDVILPTRAPDGRPGKALRLRCVTTPDEHQQILLSRLGLTLPKRLRWVEEQAGDVKM